ncbi:hypothetical protein [Vibrio sp. 99-8-1]|nr:hypothetical protein [Vibrio sp. 99-8-1]
MSLLARHDYIDGKYHFSCASCHDIATLDVRLFNKDELTLNGSRYDSMQK